MNVSVGNTKRYQLSYKTLCSVLALKVKKTLDSNNKRSIKLTQLCRTTKLKPTLIWEYNLF